MTYLGYVIPYLFPHYRPPLLENGRAWMLGLLPKNQAPYRTALSLSSYFVSVALAATGPDHETTMARSLWEVQKQAGAALKTIQRDLREINNRGMQDNLIEGAYLMESVIQMLSYEVSIGCTSEPRWRCSSGSSSTMACKTTSRVCPSSSKRLAARQTSRDVQNIWLGPITRRRSSSSPQSYFSTISSPAHRSSRHRDYKYIMCISWPKTAFQMGRRCLNCKNSLAARTGCFS